MTPLSLNPLPTTEGATQTTGPGWTLGLCIGECRDQANDQAFQEAGFADFMRATADHLERLRAIDNAKGVTQGWQPIETVPSTDSDDDPIPVLLGTERHVAIGSAFNRRDGSKRARASFCLGIEWTHWQPLPPPPGQNT